MNIQISIHALHEESDHACTVTTINRITFQSTLSMRRATSCLNGYAQTIKFQSTLSMRRATVEKHWFLSILLFQSTLSMRRATEAQSAVAAQAAFQSTLSMRRATTSWVDSDKLFIISIHALHEESDLGRSRAF